MTQVYVRIWDHSVCAILWGGAILCRSSTDLMRYFCPLSESFVKILPSLVQKEWILRSRLAQVSSWMMPCRYRVRSSVMKTSEFFSFRFAEKICCFVFQSTYYLRSSLAVWFSDWVWSVNVLLNKLDAQFVPANIYDDIIGVGLFILKMTIVKP